MKSQKQQRQRFLQLYEELNSLCNDMDYKDPFTGDRGREIYISLRLGHNLGENYLGADGYDSEGACEYKSTNQKYLKGIYGTLPIGKNLTETIELFKELKIRPYKNHYYVRFNKLGIIEEVYKLRNNVVQKILLPKLRVEYKRFKAGGRKDNRIRLEITNGDIKKYGKKVKLLSKL